MDSPGHKMFGTQRTKIHWSKEETREKYKASRLQCYCVTTCSACSFFSIKMMTVMMILHFASQFTASFGFTEL